MTNFFPERDGTYQSAKRYSPLEPEPQAPSPPKPKPKLAPIKDSWRVQKNLLQAEELPTMDETVEGILNIPDTRVQALVAIMYLTGARVSEIVRKTQKDGTKLPSIKLKNIKGLIVYDKEIVKFSIKNEKNKSRLRKDIPIVTSDPRNKVLLELIADYCKGFSEEDELFPISRDRAYKLIIKYVECNPHFLRHLRLTHLVQEYNFTDSHLVLQSGWTDSRPAKHYVDLNWKNLIPK